MDWKACLLMLLTLTIGCGKRDQNPAAEKSGTAKGIILLRYNQGSESTEQRERGFLETLSKEFPEIPILSSDQYAGTTPEVSLDKAQQMLAKYRDRVGGIFAVCEPNARGVLGALEQESLAGKVKFVGFDSSPEMIDALRDGKMDGIVLQDPVRMGYLATKTLLAHLNGEKVEKRIPTGEYVATKTNMESPEIAALLKPEQFNESAAGSDKAKYTLAVIPKGTTHEFWKSVHAGAAKAAKESGDTQILWKGPLLESDRDDQITVVQGFVAKKVSGIILAPLDAQSLVDPVKDAKQADIPTVIFDSALNDNDVIVSYVATDNYEGGKLAARCLAEAMGYKANAATTAK